jgi:hypothetical protein
LGIYDGSGALTDQQKILAAQKVIFEQTGDAQGDFARTSDGLANSQRTLTAQMENLQVSIGQALLPVVEAILPLVQSFAAWAADNPEMFLAIAGAIAVVAAAIVATNIAMALNPFALIAAGVALLVAGLVFAYKKFEVFRTGVNAVVNGIIGVFEAFANSWIKVINVIIKGYNALPLLPDIGYINEISLGRVGGQTSNPSRTMDIPKLAEGGIVRSARWRACNDRRKRPRSSSASRSLPWRWRITINVTGGLATSAEIGESVVNALRAYSRSAGPLQLQVA